MKPWFWPGLYRVGRGIPQLSVFQGGSEEQRLQGWCNKGRQISRCLLEHRSTCVHQRPDIASEVVLLVVGLALLCLTRPPHVLSAACPALHPDSSLSGRSPIFVPAVFCCLCDLNFLTLLRLGQDHGASRIQDQLQGEGQGLYLV